MVMENKVANFFHPNSCTPWNLYIGPSLKTAVLDIPAKKM
jgi:hypothetical protein